jgi:hypothetical protein
MRVLVSALSLKMNLKFTNGTLFIYECFYPVLTLHCFLNFFYFGFYFTSHVIAYSYLRNRHIILDKCFSLLFIYLIYFPKNSIVIFKIKCWKWVRFERNTNSIVESKFAPSNFKLFIFLWLLWGSRWDIHVH